jgi:hypothetical protein
MLNIYTDFLYLSGEKKVRSHNFLKLLKKTFAWPIPYK